MSNSTQDTEDVVELIDQLRRGANVHCEDLIGRLAAKAADRLQSLSDRIDVLEAELAKAQCAHEWEWIKTLVESDGVTNHITMRCSKCLSTTISEHRAAPHQEGIAP